MVNSEIIKHPVIGYGAGAYMITGGTNGAIMMVTSLLISLAFLFMGAPLFVTLLASLFMGLMTSLASSGEINWATTLIGLFAGIGSTSLLITLLTPQILSMSVLAIAASPLGVGLIMVSVLLMIIYVGSFALYAYTDKNRDFC